MLGFFGDLTIFLKFDSVCIENNVFKLHYKATVIILVCASLIVTSGQYIGSPINCMADGIDGGVMDIYCWISSTFSIPSKWVGRQGEDHAYPGVAPIEIVGKEPKYHKYYQWVCFVLMIQACLFYVPRYIWKSAEDKRMKSLVEDMNNPNFVVDKGTRRDRIDFIVSYYRERRGTHLSYSLKYFLCEILNFGNVIGQMFLMDRFLGYEFSTYGINVLAHTESDPRDRPDPMAVVFPKVTKCSFQKYGASGTIERLDALCVLPINIINEKIYIFLWVWFIFLAAITGIFLVYRFFVVLAPGVRSALIQARTGRGITRDTLNEILRGHGLNYFQQIGDFFLLYLISKNVDEVTMKELMLALHKDLSSTEVDLTVPQPKESAPVDDQDQNIITLPETSTTSV